MTVFYTKAVISILRLFCSCVNCRRLQSVWKRRRPCIKNAEFFAFFESSSIRETRILRILEPSKLPYFLEKCFQIVFSSPKTCRNTCPPPQKKRSFCNIFVKLCVLTTRFLTYHGFMNAPYSARMSSLNTSLSFKSHRPLARFSCSAS